MPDPGNPNFTSSFNLFLRGQKILTGGQRIHDAQMLEEQVKIWRASDTLRRHMQAQA